MEAAGDFGILNAGEGSAVVLGEREGVGKAEADCCGADMMGGRRSFVCWRVQSQGSEAGEALVRLFENRDRG